MSFSTLFFIFVFLPASLILYYVFPARLRKVPLLLLSILFFAWSRPSYLVFILLSLAVNYIGSRLIAIYKALKRPTVAKAVLITTLIVDTVFLVMFKYLEFIISNLNLIPGISLSAPNVSAPIGLMFYIPTLLSYLLDVYLDRVPVEKNVLNYAVYATFFPKFLSGPIVQYKDMVQQLQEDKLFQRKNLYEGFKLFSIGLFKKVLIADGLGLVFSSIHELTAMSVSTAWLGMLCYTLELYFDFSGYSDMAIGISAMLGYRIAPNFNYPYRSLDINDFWRRWHISLGAWFREYIYFPLGGNRCSDAKNIRNLLVVWLLTGLWHGASWNFIVWGMWHCAFAMLYRFVIKDRLNHTPRSFRVLLTFLIVSIGWVPFFSADLRSALHYLAQLFGAGHMGIIDSTFLYWMKSSAILLIVAVIGSGPLPKTLQTRLVYLRGKRALRVATLVWLVLFLFSIANIVSSTYTSFLYFQF